jgi:heme exporter protein D
MKPDSGIETQPEAFRLGDSPWFWLALFGTIAVLALLAISPKYARRQLRLESRHQHRLQARSRRPDQAPTTPRRELPAGARTDNPKATLVPLLAVFAMLAISGYLGLYFSHRRHRAGSRCSEPPSTFPMRN